MLRVENNSFNPCCSYHSIGAGTFLITAVALATIGLLALFKIPALSTVSPYWYAFGLGALASFAVGVVCCCRCLCVTLEQLPPSEPEQVSLTTPSTPPPIQEPRTAEEWFVQARECVQGKKDQKNYPRAMLLYKQAMKLGHVPSIFYLGKCYLLGKGTPPDQAKAISLFQEAATKGHSESIYALVLLDLEQDKIDEAIVRLQTLPDYNVSLKTTIDTFLSHPRTPNTIALLKKMIEISAGHFKAARMLERKVAWRYV